ncbi:hypothetical protein CDEF62S_03496 [Castellaniella defragrans]
MNKDEASTSPFKSWTIRPENPILVPPPRPAYSLWHPASREAARDRTRGLRACGYWADAGRKVRTTASGGSTSAPFT